VTRSARCRDSNFRNSPAKAGVSCGPVSGRPAKSGVRSPGLCRVRHNLFCSDCFSWNQIQTQAPRRSTARSLSALKTVPRNSRVPRRLHAGQKPERKFTLTPGNAAASHSATGRQQHSTCPASADGGRSIRLCSLAQRGFPGRRGRKSGTLASPPCTGVIVEFEIREPHIKHTIQHSRACADPCAWFSNQLLVSSGSCGHDLQNRRKMNRLGSPPRIITGACAVGERGVGPFSQFFQSHRSRRADSSLARL